MIRYAYAVFLLLMLLALPWPSTGRPPSTLEPITTWTEYPDPGSVAKVRATALPPATPTASALATHRPTASAASVSGIASGIASWYCLAGVSRCTRGHPSGMFAAIRRDLLFLRGHDVTVCAGDRCIVVTVIDCNCGATANLIDLYSDAFRVLRPLSRGIVPVQVSWHLGG